MISTGGDVSGTPFWRATPASRRDVVRTIAILLGIALAIRLLVLVCATLFGPDGSVGDVVYHAQMVRGPISHLHGHQPDTKQYAPYLGLLEWLTVKPWMVLGVRDLTALRLGSITWDLIGMAVLLAATAKRFPERLWFVGLLWAAAPVFWPASAYSAQDELIAAALLAGVVYLLFTDRRLQAIGLCVTGLFLLKILLLPVVLALLVTTKRNEIPRAIVTIGAVFVGMVGLTFVLTGSDGLSQQAGYEVDVIGFSISIWSTLVLHHVIDPRPAIRLSLLFVTAAVGVTFVLWLRHRRDDVLEAPRLAAALLLASFAVLAVSNPEYLCLVAPLAIVGCIGLERTVQPWLFVATAGVAWAINGVYYLLRTGYDPTGSLLGVEGFAHSIQGREKLLDLAHQGLLVVFLACALGLAWNFLLAPDRVEQRSA